MSNNSWSCGFPTTQFLAKSFAPCEIVIPTAPSSKRKTKTARMRTITPASPTYFAEPPAAETPSTATQATQSPALPAPLVPLASPMARVEEDESGRDEKKVPLSLKRKRDAALFNKYLAATVRYYQEEEENEQETKETKGDAQQEEQTSAKKETGSLSPSYSPTSPTGRALDGSYEVPLSPCYSPISPRGASYKEPVTPPGVVETFNNPWAVLNDPYPCPVCRHSPSSGFATSGFATPCYVCQASSPVVNTNLPCDSAEGSYEVPTMASISEFASFLVKRKVLASNTHMRQVLRDFDSFLREGKKDTEEEEVAEVGEMAGPAAEAVDGEAPAEKRRKMDAAEMEERVWWD